MTKDAQEQIITDLHTFRAKYVELAATHLFHPEDRQAYHGLACSLDKLIRRAEAKVPLEFRPPTHPPAEGAKVVSIEKISIPTSKEIR